jgi:hypothetical protein
MSFYVYTITNREHIIFSGRGEREDSEEEDDDSGDSGGGRGGGCNIPKNIDQKLIFGAWMRERVVGRWMQSQETSEASFLSPTKP